MSSTFANLNAIALPKSKSFMHRQLMMDSFLGAVSICPDSADTLAMSTALQDFVQGKKSFHAGAAAAVFRMLALRISREPGEFFIGAHPRLIERGHQSLLDTLNQLGVSARLSPEGLHLKSPGWSSGQVKLTAANTSQVLSALVLSAFDLKQNLLIELQSRPDEWPSFSYAQMSLDMAQARGLKFVWQDLSLCLMAGCLMVEERPLVGTAAEDDQSCAAALAALALAGGTWTYSINKIQNSLQADRVFLEQFKQMGARILTQNDQVIFEHSPQLRGLEWDLKDCPDLFCVLVALACLAHGPSRFYGAKFLDEKESPRMTVMCQHLAAMGVPYVRHQDQLTVNPNGLKPAPITLSTHGDHRVAMALLVLKQAGWPIGLDDSTVLNKSFPTLAVLT